MFLKTNKLSVKQTDCVLLWPWGSFSAGCLSMQSGLRIKPLKVHPQVLSKGVEWRVLQPQPAPQGSGRHNLGWTQGQQKEPARNEQPITSLRARTKTQHHPSLAGGLAGGLLTLCRTKIPEDDAAPQSPRHEGDIETRNKQKKGKRHKVQERSKVWCNWQHKLR